MCPQICSISRPSTKSTYAIVHHDWGAHFTHRKTEAQRQKDLYTCMRLELKGFQFSDLQNQTHTRPKLAGSE